MARKPRKRPERDTGRIEIERNVIEKFLMEVKEYLRKNRMIAIYAVLGLVAAAAIVIAILVVVDGVNTRNKQRYEIIMKEYEAYQKDGDTAKIESATIKDLKAFIDSTHFGFTRSLARYSLGNIYFSRKEYKQAKTYLVAYADAEPKTDLAPLALLKAAVALEEENDLKGARELYRRMEDRYSGSFLADQVFFNYARICAKMNDRIEARKHYNRVISAYPESAYVQLAKKRLFLLGPQ